MLIKKGNSTKIKNSETCYVWDYNFSNKNLGFATAKINGRYPEKGMALNVECDEIYFVISGSGIVHNQEGKFEIEAGDALLLSKGKHYWVEGKELFITLPSSPAWNVEQYKIVE